MLAFVNVSSTIGALARMLSDLHATSTQVLWITSAYSLVVACLVLGAGALGDLIGRRLLFMAGVVFFIVGSLAAFTADATGVLIAAQVASRGRQPRLHRPAGAHPGDQHVGQELRPRPGRRAARGRHAARPPLLALDLP